MSEKIVVIEDNQDVRNNLSEILQSADYQIFPAENGASGLELIKREQPDLILCDIMMPEMDGYDVLRRVRNNQAVAATPFVFLTAKTAREDLSKGMELGADDYIMKPFTISELLNRVKTRLTKRKEVLKRSEEKLEELASKIGTPITNELNEPLKTILGIGELIMTEHFSMEKNEIVEFVSLIHKAGLELRSVVGATLGYYEIENLIHDPGHLEELKRHMTKDTESVIKSIAQEEAEQAGRESDLVFSLVPASVFMPETYLQRILVNLINNAFKFSPRGSMVRVISGVENGHLLITISDEGIGMAEEDVQRIGAYRKFNDEDQVTKGLGLGLFNAMRLVELFDGSLTFNSNKGVGTIVKIRLKAD